MAQGTSLEDLTATVNDVVFCLKEIQGQVETLRQHICHLRITEESQRMLDAEIQTLKAEVGILKKSSAEKARQREGKQIFEMRLLIHELDAQRSAEIQGMRDAVIGLKESFGTQMLGLKLAYEGTLDPDVQQEERPPINLEPSPSHMAAPCWAWDAQQSDFQQAQARALAATDEARKAALAEKSQKLAISRSELIEYIFQAFNANNNVILEKEEMLQFMSARGGLWNREVWAEEWDELDPMNIHLFSDLISDPDKGDYYCSDAQLSSIAVACFEPFYSQIPSLTSQAEEISGEKLLHIMEHGDELEAVLKLTSIGINELNDRDQFGSSALHIASDRGFVQACHKLLARADFDHVNERDWGLFGSTALHLAARSGHRQVCLALLESQRFTEDSGGNSEGDTALHQAAKEGHVNVCQLLLDHSDFTAANATNMANYTALHLAALHGHGAVCQVLVNHPKFNNKDAQGAWGSTAAQMAEGEAKRVLGRFAL